MSKITVAAIQTGSKLFELNRTIDLFAQKLTAAKNASADLAVFPEAFIGGYPKGIDFGVKVGSRSPEGREQFRRYYESAVERGSDELTRIQKLVHGAGINTVLGIIERDAGTLYCASATIGRSGDILAWHRKLMPTAMERIIWGQGDGSSMQVADTDIGTVSMAICWENYMPFYRAHLYAQGTQIHCAPTVDDREVWLPTMQMIALEGRCFVISACQFMTRGDVADKDYTSIQGKAPDTVLINGGSCIVSPFGEVLAAPVFGKEAMLIAELNMDDIARGKFDQDVAGHYARPDIFSLSVNTAPQNFVDVKSKS